MDELRKFSTNQGVPPGAPGAPLYVGDNVPYPTQISAIEYNADKLTQRAVTDVSEFLQGSVRDENYVWINVEGLASSSLIMDLCQQWEIHPLVVEDIVNTTQRPKVDYFENYIFIVLKLPELNKEGEMVFEQISMLLTNHTLITFQEKPGGPFDLIRKRLQNNQSRLRKHGVDYLCYALMDVIVDDYFNLIEEKSEHIEELEDALINQTDELSLDKLYLVKREVMSLRKVIQPFREMITRIIKEDEYVIQDGAIIYFRDLYDHCLRLLETLDMQRETLANVLEIYLSNMNNKLNETMKVLTIFASIFIPLTFVTGLYGMNFNYMPELTWRYGYFAVLGVMGAIVGGLLYFFRRKKWI